MQIVLLENVLLPVYVFDFEGGLCDTTDEALVVYFGVNFCFICTLFGERINDDTEEDVHQDDVDYHEECEIEDQSRAVSRVSVHWLLQDVSASSSGAEADEDG